MKSNKINISQAVGNRYDVSFYNERFDFISNSYPSYELGQILFVNPAVSYKHIADDDLISFVPMEAIDEQNGIIAIRKTILYSNIKGYTKFQEGDLLWAKITPCMQNGKSAIARNLVNGVGCGSTEFYVLRPKSDKVLIEYIHYILRDNRVLESARNSFGGSAGQQRVSSSYLKSIKIPLPPIEIQQQIVDIYTTAQKAKQAKEEQAKVLLNSVQNELGNILGITQAQEFVPAYKLHIKDIIGDRLDVKFHNPRYIDYIKSISRSTYYRLGDIVEFSSETWNQKDIFETHFPYIEIGAIDTTTGEIIDISNVEIGKAPSRAKKIVRHNDIIVSTTRPNRGAISIVDNEVCIASTGFSVIRDIKDIVLREFLYIVLRLESSLEQMMQRSSGGNYPAITEDELKKILIPVPPLEVQRKVINFVTENRRAVKQLQNESERLLGAVKVQIEKMILG